MFSSLKFGEAIRNFGEMSGKESGEVFLGEFGKVGGCLDGEKVVVSFRMGGTRREGQEGGNVL